MRPSSICVFWLLAVAAPYAAISSNSAPDVTVVVTFKGPYSAPAVKAMQAEAGRIIGASGIRLEWSTRADAADKMFNDLVVMTFKGSCVFNPMPMVADELGPYAITRTAGGEVQPFGEVDCDHVVSSLHSAMGSADYTKADALLGRALGRIVAHELVHMLTRSRQHAHEGVERAVLSPRQLISDSLPLSTLDVDRLQERHNHKSTGGF